MSKKDEALADSALEHMAENARELGLDYEPPCKTGSQCTNKCPQCDEPAQQLHCNDCGGFDPECPLAQPAQKEQQVSVPVTDNTYNYAKNLAESIFKQHFASDEHYASGRIVWDVNDTVIGILTQIDNMVADMVRRPTQQPEYKHCDDGKVILKNPEVLSQLLREQQQEEPKRWAVFCSQCRKEWSVSYPHPGKSICAECDAKVGAQQQEPDK